MSQLALFSEPKELPGNVGFLASDGAVVRGELHGDRLTVLAVNDREIRDPYEMCVDGADAPVLLPRTELERAERGRGRWLFGT